MKFGEAHSPGRPIPLAPLIDVVFILLVFFMLASSYLDWRAIDLRVTRSDATATVSQPALVIRLKADGSSHVGRDMLSPESLRRRIETAIAENSDLRVTILSEPGVALQRAVDTLDNVKDLGATDVSFARVR